jgi:twitching motility protein PilT
MKTLQHMLRELGRPDVAELAMASDRLPCVKVAGKYKAIDDNALSTEAILQMLVASGGSRYLEELDTRPAAWTLRLDGIGSVGVQVAMREGRVQARFVVVRKVSVSAIPAARRRSSRPAEGTAPVASRPPLTAKPPARKSIPASRAASRRSSIPAARPPKRSKPPSDPTQAAAAATPLAFAVVSPVQPTPTVAATGQGAPASDVDALLALARQAGASDLHVVAGRPMLVRLAGELLARGTVIPEEVVERIVSALVPPRLAPVLASQGSCDFALDGGRTGRFRVNVARQRSGLKACFRLIAPEIPTLASLGLPGERRYG